MLCTCIFSDIISVELEICNGLNSITLREKISRGKNFTVSLNREILRTLRGFNFAVLRKKFFVEIYFRGRRHNFLVD